MHSSLQPIFSRRSIRRYTDKEITPELIQDLLEAGMAAPSACAKDPWHFVVLTSRASIDRLAECLPNGKMLTGAPAALVVCGDINKAHDRELSFLLQDVSAAVENILLAANMLGLGSCWLGIHPRQERMDAVRKQLGLPPEIIPVAGISLGWPAEIKEARTRFNDKAVHMERW